MATKKTTTTKAKAKTNAPVKASQSKSSTNIVSKTATKGTSSKSKTVVAKPSTPKVTTKPVVSTPTTTTAAPTGNSQNANRIGKNDPIIKTDYNSPNDVGNDAFTYNKQAAGDTSELSNPSSYTDAFGNNQTVKYDSNGRPIVTQKLGGLADALYHGIGDTAQASAARQNARLGQAAYGSGDVNADRQRVENGLIARYNEVYQPQFQQEQTNLDTQLINRGFAPGTKAYDDAMFQLRRSQNDTKSQFISNALQTGGTELERNYKLDESSRNQALNETTSLQDQIDALKPTGMPQFQGAKVDAPNIESIYQGYTGAKTSKDNNQSSIAAARELQLRNLQAQNAAQQGANQGNPSNTGSQGGSSKIAMTVPNEGQGGFSIANPGHPVGNAESPSVGTTPTPNIRPSTQSMIRTQPASGQSTALGAPRNSAPRPVSKPPTVASTIRGLPRFNPFGGSKGILKGGRKGIF